MFLIQYILTCSSCILPLPPTLIIIVTPCTELGPLRLHGPVNYFPPRLQLWLTGILTQRRQESSDKSKMLIPTMLPSGQFLKTRGDFLHANACLDPCRAIDAWPLFYRALRLLITPARLSLLRWEWGRSRGGSHRSVSTGIFDCHIGWLCQDTALCGNEGGHFECTKRLKWAKTYHFELAGWKPARSCSTYFILLFNDYETAAVKRSLFIAKPCGLYR